jgi:uncharacterized protein (TIGR02996 family)
MTDRAALLSAILVNPDDDIARLVYADALEETAEPAAVARARFIRLQIECARSSSDGETSHPESGRAREIEALAARWARVWFAELPGAVANAVREKRLGAGAFRRGFVDGVTLSASAFLWTAPKLFAAAPVTEMHLHGGFKNVKTALASPYIRRLRGVRLSGGWRGDRFAELFLYFGHALNALRELDLSGCRLTDHGARELARRSALENLTVLRVRSNLLTEEGIELLATAPGLAKLIRLDVTGNPGVHTWTDEMRFRYRTQLVFDGDGR